MRHLVENLDFRLCVSEACVLACACVCVFVGEWGHVQVCTCASQWRVQRPGMRKVRASPGHGMVAAMAWSSERSSRRRAEGLRPTASDGDAERRCGGDLEARASETGRVTGSRSRRSPAAAGSDPDWASVWADGLYLADARDILGAAVPAAAAAAAHRAVSVPGRCRSLPEPAGGAGVASSR